MNEPTIIRNTSCIRCDAVQKLMMKVGGVVMCDDCFWKVFTTPDPPVDQKVTYQRWLKATHERDQLECG